MADPAIGGAILGEACHFVDLMYWLLESEPVAVSAFTLPTGRPHPIGENNLVASFRFADGSIGNLTYCTIGSRTSGGERVEVFGEGFGVATEDFTRLDVRDNVRRTQSSWWPDKGYAGLVESFVRAARTDVRRRSPCVTAPAPRSAVSRCSSLRGRVCLERSTSDDWRHKKANVSSDRIRGRIRRRVIPTCGSSAPVWSISPEFSNAISIAVASNLIRGLAIVFDLYPLPKKVTVDDRIRWTCGSCINSLLVSGCLLPLAFSFALHPAGAAT